MNNQEMKDVDVDMVKELWLECYYSLNIMWCIIYCDDGCLLMELKCDGIVNCAWVRVRVGFGKCGVVLVPARGV